ncbi:MAG TPA: Hsp20 family protein [Pseudonocardia sp.]|nr:Hsp20 family protein [Pseudonocardia sp.]
MSTLPLWTSSDPFAEFDTLVRRAFGPGTAHPSGFTPAAEVVRDGDDAVISVELPGLDAEQDVTVEVTGDRLTIRGERKDQYSEQRDGRHCARSATARSIAHSRCPGTCGPMR